MKRNNCLATKNVKRRGCYSSGVLSSAAEHRSESLPTSGQFSLTYTFTTSMPASPMDIGDGKDLTVNRYLATMANDNGQGFLRLEHVCF